MLVARSFLIMSIAVWALSAAPAAGQQIVDAERLGGFSFSEDGVGDAAMVPSVVEFDTGFGSGTGFGVGFTNGFRIEGEITIRRSGIDGLGSSFAPDSLPAEIGGLSTSWSFMANTIYSLDTGTALRPYVGAGVGAAITNFDVGHAGTGAALPSLGDSDASFAYQGIAGMEYDIGSGLGAGVEYRYFATQDPIASPTGPGRSTTGDGESRSHHGYFVLRQRF